MGPSAGGLLRLGRGRRAHTRLATLEITAAIASNIGGSKTGIERLLAPLVPNRFTVGKFLLIACSIADVPRALLLLPQVYV